MLSSFVYFGVTEKYNIIVIMADASAPPAPVQAPP